MTPVAPFHTEAAVMPRVYIVGDTYTFLLTGAQTGGACTMFHARVPPGKGLPPHVHHREDEIFHVLKGRIAFEVGGRTFTAGPGEVVYGTRDVPHLFRNVGDEEAEMVITCIPGGIDGFFLTAGLPAPDPAQPAPEPTAEDIERLLATARDYGIEIFPPTEGDARAVEG